ncbi:MULTISPECIES: undecaprenyl-diphosphate phosphatase [Commensalibacter]|uniref:Undecaprenyl-diphosphatase n=2 Tax=Commensalibacter TaxID=1079922 RepID=W7DWZ3_9PROT|nr:MULTISPECIES: undecaprenyl-diphosphate phosphatase [Commensalibacter]EUK18713.1 undecaprenyl pyrophosphate phosphatase [Commensalibacter papalotli (ex Servin-Garciduenas et al. 2014)]CAI3923242.1 Undecaprenyl pyrophosphate phosphatase (UppP) (PDB:5OON) [Commensalibacter papalotli (ex Botero et al. 2024)]CAI3928908.1 Undecaprenyl pyrophosphate phosphatase (UppP) (PDB:5OON) [Commensalibacter papalotli (ex Botero et al. 2024)]
MSFLQAIFIAILQGATELFPVSSLGHAVVIPALLGWLINPQDQTFLPFIVMLHFGTMFALLIFFWKDWQALTRGVMGKEGPAIREQSIYVVLLLVIATLPAIIIGSILESFIRGLFSTPEMVSIFLICNGLMLFAAEKLRKKNQNSIIAIADLTPKDALIIGCFQCLAFFPGLSRSGATIVGGVIHKLSYENAARFSFLLALPIIFAATIHQTWKIYKHNIPIENFGTIFIATIVGGVTALISTTLIMKYFHNHEKLALTPFSFYCIALGSISLLIFLI